MCIPGSYFHCFNEGKWGGLDGVCGVEFDKDDGIVKGVKGGWRERFEGFKNRLESREPLQYILGSWDFRTLNDITCRRPTLVPRPETEELCGWAIDFMNETGGEVICRKVLDVGTGTGCIGISMACEVQGVKVSGVEKDDNAKVLTEENVEAFKEQFGEGSSYEGVWYGGIEEYEEGGYDVIVSNPPYIPKRDMEGLEENVKGWEDHGALEGGEDGMDVIREILKYATERGGVKKGGVVFIEGDEGHPSMVEREAEGKGWKVEKRMDVRGIERFVKITI
ncbi:hypothetical protein TrCOL_g11147 [Triparma columacea]|uniref:peptide chain release factor N(5)-glutamine methyltransferase n=1 Tax=Triparma columacea TaxID=722753 RepID=A0A9W7LG18_9STRA|nr:hypothetical protein TrCOL_g11147 [Triparma columacea]